VVGKRVIGGWFAGKREKLWKSDSASGRVRYGHRRGFLAACKKKD
jgi:hypothetical protein